MIIETTDDEHNKLVKEENKQFTSYVVSKLFLDPNDKYEESEESESEIDNHPDERGGLISLTLLIGKNKHK